MAHYRVVVVHLGPPWEPEVLKVSAPDPYKAYASLGAEHRGPDVVQVLVIPRGPRALLRRRSMAFPGGSMGGDGPGTAGVREPRRPKPAPPSLRASLDEP